MAFQNFVRHFVWTILCYQSVSTHMDYKEPCVWPDFFDVSSTSYTATLAEKSWETELKVNDASQINGELKYRKRVTILSNSLFEISDGDGTFGTEQLSCYEDFGNNTFMLKTTKVSTDQRSESSNDKEAYTDSESFRCMRLVKRSKYVIQWSLGNATINNTQKCSSDTQEVSPWPLVHIPYKMVRLELDRIRLQDFLLEAPPCPSLGGFEMRKKKPSPCEGKQFLARVDLGCSPGDGVRFLPSDIGCPQMDLLGGESKFVCLAHWDHANYTFIVLMPSSPSEIRSFHCLRILKENLSDPPALSYSAVLFLDNVCGLAEPNSVSANFVEMEFRQKNITSICDDSSNECENANCSLSGHACFRSCDSCPFNLTSNTTSIAPDVSIRGSWLLQLGGVRKTLHISDKDFLILRTFKAYANGVCLGPANALRQDSVVYNLARLGDGPGCGTRVMQFRAKRLSHSLLLAQFTGTAPLRSDPFSLNTSTWCHNNYFDILKGFEISRYGWPFNSLGSIGSGLFTLVKDRGQRASSCMFDREDVAYAAHMEVLLEFSSGTKKYVCLGETHVEVDKYWWLNYDCSDGPQGSIRFVCLGSYEVSSNHTRAIALMTPPMTSDFEPMYFPDRFYCLLLPTEYRQQDRMYLLTAGECDHVTEVLVRYGYRKPKITITRIASISEGAMLHFSFLLLLPGLFWNFK